VEIIRKNFGLKVLSFALALVGWAYFRYANNPILAARSQQFSIPIVAVNLPAGYVAAYGEKEALITVSARRGRPEASPDDVKAVLDLSGKQAGAYNVPVQLIAPDVTVQSLSPATVSLSIERAPNQQ
jgi:hypothetical protein